MFSYRPLSIRTILLITISALTLLIVGLSLRAAYIECVRMSHIQSLYKATFTSDQLFEVSEKLSTLRDITYYALYNPDKDSSNEMLQKILLSRQDSDATLEKAIASLKTYNFPKVADKIVETEEEYNRLKYLQAKIDQEMLRPAKERNRQIIELWFEQITALILKTQDVWLELLSNYRDIDPMVTLHLRFKHFLGIIIDHTGRERSLISRFIIENTAPTPDEQAKLLKWQNAIEIGWDRIRAISEESSLNGVVDPYLKDAESHYTTVYEMVHDLFYIPGVKHAAPYPMSAALWLEISSQTTDSLYDLKNVSLKETRNYVELLKHQAIISILTNIIFLVISISLCLYSFWVITFRVSYPVNHMVGALIAATEGRKVKINPQMINGNDEVSQLAKVLITLQRSSERYRALVEASSQVIWTWEPGEQGDGMEILKKWWEEVTGQPKGEIMPFGWLQVVHPEDREHAGNAWKMSSVTGKAFEAEYRIRARNGSYRHIYVRGVPLKNDDGSLIEIVGALNDVTTRKEAEIAVKSYMEDLERSNKELDDFAYIASHDLKEPLRGIHNHSRFLMEDNADKLDEDSVNRLGRLVYLSQRMERLVNDLLYFSRIGRQDLAIQETDINEVIKDIENTLDVFLKENNAHIKIADKLPQIICDKTRVTEVFRNLITNAIKYNDKEVKNVEIGFLPTYLAKDGSKIENVFYVKDDGNGIAEEFYTEIFRIFKRLQSSKNKEEEGTGVGLTFVKKIIERHGGRIWLESEIGKGTTFYFVLKGEK
jgi:PAS domain S-box-containing protein